MNGEIKKIMDNINCNNNFKCYYDGIENFNKVKCDFLSNNCEAITNDSDLCKYCQMYSDRKFCICSLLKYLIENRNDWYLEINKIKKYYKDRLKVLRKVEKNNSYFN